MPASDFQPRHRRKAGVLLPKGNGVAVQPALSVGSVKSVKGGNLLFQVDMKSRKSIYEQVVDNIKELIVTGILSEESKLPSVRELSKTLTVNPNTVQKAYRELEHQGYIYTVTGLGCFVKGREEMQFDEKKIGQASEELKFAVRELMFMGVPSDEVKEKVDEVYSEGRVRD